MNRGMNVVEKLVDAVGYCGLICEGCTNTEKGCKGCRCGGGADDCYQRTCCLQKGIEGCWLCKGSPCDKGFFDPYDKVWSGLCRGFIRCINNKGVKEFISLAQSRLGKTVEYGELRFKREEEIMRLLGIDGF